MGHYRSGHVGDHQGNDAVQLRPPLLFAIGCRLDEAWVRRYDGKNGGEVDAAIVATYLMLAAENEDLAMLWVGSF